MIILDGLNLTGELSKDGEVTVSGWNKNSVSSGLKNGRLKTLRIQNSNISLLTEQYGGLAIDYDLQVRLQGRQIEFQAHATSRQKSTSFVTSSKGYINEEGVWQADVEIERGKFEFSNIKASRINGSLNVLGAKNQPVKIVSELRAGGASLYGLPWQTVTASLEGSPESYQIFTDMESIGSEGLELSLSLRKRDEQTFVSGQLYAETPETLLEYLDMNRLQPLSEDEIREIKGAKHLNIDFIFEDPEIRFYIKNMGKDIDIEGNFSFDK
jgi:hypothetical protein